MRLAKVAHMMLALTLSGPATMEMAAAQAIAEDLRGGTSALTPPAGGGTVGVNTGDASIQASFAWLSRGFLLGTKAKAKAQAGVGGLLSQGDLQPGVEAGVVLGRVLQGGHIVGVRGSLGRMEVTLFDSSLPIDSAVSTRQADHGELMLSFNTSGPTTWVGVAAGARHLTNADELKKVTVRKELATRTGENGVVETVVQEVKAQTGPILEGWIGEIRGDLVQRIGRSPFSMRGYIRAPAGGDEELHRTRFGMDLSYFEQDLLWGRRLGLVLEFVDPSRLAASGTRTESKWTLGLVGSLPF